MYNLLFCIFSDIYFHFFSVPTTVKRCIGRNFMPGELAKSQIFYYGKFPPSLSNVKLLKIFIFAFDKSLERNPHTHSIQLKLRDCVIDHQTRTYFLTFNVFLITNFHELFHLTKEFNLQDDFGETRIWNYSLSEQNLVPQFILSPIDRTFRHTIAYNYFDFCYW